LLREVGFDGAYHLWASESIARSNVFHAEFVRHFFLFPGEIFLSTWPCSVVVLPLLTRDFRNRLGVATSPAQYHLGAFAFAFLTCWLAPGGEERYLMPVFPSLACLAGLTWERLNLELSSGRTWNGKWKLARLSCTGLMLVCAVGALAWVCGVPPTQSFPLSASAGGALAYVAVVGGLATLFWRGSRPASPSLLVAHAAFAGFIGLTYNWGFLGVMQARCNDMQKLVAEGRRAVPANVPLVSLGPITHRFALYYPEAVRMLPADAAPTADVCFCLDWYGNTKPPLRFDWELLATVPVDRYRRDVSVQPVVVIGRRLREADVTARDAPGDGRRR
jgi:hypothetical protein